MKAPPAGGWPGCASSEGFFIYKATHFNVDRLHIFHYAIFGQKHPDHRSGDGERHGNDFLVTLSEFPPQSRRTRTFSWAFSCTSSDTIWVSPMATWCRRIRIMR